MAFSGLVILSMLYFVSLLFGMGINPRPSENFSDGLGFIVGNRTWN
jgi:hypothetical protein